MILELIATCLLSAGMVFAVPDGWRVETVGNAGTPTVAGPWAILTYCSPKPCGQIDQTYVVLRRAVKAGESVEAPPGCALRAEAKP